MSDTYLDTFNTRGDSYNEAALIHPLARDVERRILIDLLDLEPAHRVCDAPAGGGYLADGVAPLVADPRHIVCVEPSQTFAATIDPRYVVHIAPLDALPLADGSVDRVGSLAGLHHLVGKRAFFHEAFRVLRPGGRIAVGDVLDGTPVAAFLNGPVDRFTTTGHEGHFLQPGETAALLNDAGFADVTEEHREFSWTFDGVDQMVRYCKSLFGLVNAELSEVREALDAHFEVEESGGVVRLPWSLVYGTGTRPPPHA